MYAPITLSLTICSFFFFNDPATTEIYTLSLHDALPICPGRLRGRLRLGSRVQPGLPPRMRRATGRLAPPGPLDRGDRKSTRLNSSHLVISYAVFCLKKKKYYNSYIDTAVSTMSTVILSY